MIPSAMRIDSPIENAATIPEMFFARVRVRPEAIAYEYKEAGEWRQVSYRDYAKLVATAACVFQGLGIQPGDCVAIWGHTTPEWSICDLGAMTAGAHVAGVYQTCTPEQAAYILNDCRAKVLCVDTPERLQLALGVRQHTRHLKHILVWCPGDSKDAPALMELLRQGAQDPAGKETREMLAALRPDLYATLVYTSGTTGPPKGVILDHANCMACCRALLAESDLLREDDTTVCYLPLSHVAEHAGLFARIYAGLRVFYCPDMSQLGAVMREKSPTFVFGVPRVFEKIHHRMMNAFEHAPPRRQKLIRWALEVGAIVSEKRRLGVAPGGWMDIQHRLAEKLVLSRIRQGLGGRLRFVVCGAAPIDVELIRFFEALGIIFIEAYGLSECGGVSHMNRAATRRPGTVGQPARSVECRLGPDGEVLLRSPLVFRGYLNQPAATREVLDEQGWLATGDIGEIDAEGFLRITDRKKNLIITAGGKNVAPATIELLIQREPVVNQVVVIGDRRPYLVALITINQDTVAGDGLAPGDVEERVAAAVAAANARLARFEQIKRFKILPDEFTVDSEEMTPTMKVRRNKVVEHHAATIEAMYAMRDMELVAE